MGLFNKSKEKYSDGLSKSRLSLKEKLINFFLKFKKVDEEYFSSLEDLLIESDVGSSLSCFLVEETKNYCKRNSINDSSKILEILLNKIKDLYNKDEYDSSINLTNKTNVILVMGVNGVGKTTSIAKLAYIYKNEGKKVLLVAGDTFRAGAVDQLDIWAKRIGVDIITGELEADPSSVIYDGVKKGKLEGYDIVIIDTAGRLQSKINLMNQASKMYKVIYKIIEEGPSESLLVLDATMGQNGVYQTKEFLEACNITGIVLTKMDGTSKGGIILSIKNELNIPVKYIGLGESMEDLLEFDIDNYLNGLLKEK